MMDEITERVRAFLIDNFILDEARHIGDQDSLLERRVIDSTGFLELIGFLESTYAITIADAEMIPENLETIANIRDFVRRKAAGHGHA